MRIDLPPVLRRRFDPEQRYGLRVTLFALAILLVAVPFGILLDQVVRNGPLVEYDTAAAVELHDAVRGRPVLITFLKVITFLGTPLWFFLLVSAVGGYLVWRNRYRLAAFLVVTSLGGGAVDSVIKILVDRDRPNFENPLIPLHGKSFPSGHAMSSTFVYGALLLVLMPLIPKRLRPFVIAGTAAFVLMIGTTRLALGVHFVTDVVGGIVLGLAWLAASTAAFSVWRQERGRKPVDPMRGLEPEAKRDLAPS